jgi:hypothetical protein
VNHVPKITATVVWPDGASEPSVRPDTIYVPASNGATVIQWDCGEDVTALEICGLQDGVFSRTQSNGMVKSFTTTDKNEDTALYDYTVGATRTTGQVVHRDPKIQNGS